MYKASQEAVFQSANIQLVGIRYAEIQYFTKFFTTFGTQCFLLAGFICGAVSQTPAYHADCAYFWQILYNVASATCIALTTMCLLVSVFISVFGQGLAIRGPPGSMIKAVEGMVIEQHNAVALFVGAAISYVLQMVGMYFVMMDYRNAIACSVLSGLVALYTYNAAVRIYNRFYFTSETQADQWNQENNPAEELGDLSATVFSNSPSKKSAVTSTGKMGISTTLLRRNGGGDSSATEGQDKPEKSMLGKVVSKVKKTVVGKSAPEDTIKYDDQPYYEGDNETPYVNMNDVDKSTPTTAASTNVISSEARKEAKETGGYLTVKLKKTFGLSDPWERKYFVLRGNFIYYYKDKRSCDSDPQNPINRRPIDLEGYTLVAGAVEPPYAISLVPIDADDIRKAWKFRCDTLNEFNNWIEILTTAIKSHNKDNQGDFISVLHEQM